MNPYRIHEHWTGCWQVAGHHSCAVEQLRVSKAKLEAVRGLVEKWREAEGKITEFGDPSAYNGDSCADELEALLKEPTK